MKFKILWIAGLILAATTGQARAAFVNGGFESGLIGWATSGDVSAESSYIGATYSPVEDNQFALLLAGSGPNVYTTLSQSFSASVGQVISGSAFFKANDYMPFNDDGYVKIVENGQTLFQSSVAAVGDYGSTPWTAFAYTFTSTGSYTIEAGIRNVQDNTSDSALGLDNVRLTSPAAVPEPASIAMWGLTSIGMMFARRRRQQKDLAA